MEADLPGDRAARSAEKPEAGLDRDRVTALERMKYRAPSGLEARHSTNSICGLGAASEGGAAYVLPIAFLVIFTPLAYGGVTPIGALLVQGITATTAAWWVLAMTRKGRWRFVRTSIDGPVSAFLAVAALSLLWSVYPYATKIELYKLATYVTILYLVQNVLPDFRDLTRLTWSIALFGGAFATLGLLRPEELLVQIPVYAPIADQGLDRGLRLTFVNRSNFAGYLEMVCWLCTGLALASRGTRRILLLVLGAYAALAVLLSLSRGGMIGLIGGYLGIIVCSSLRRDDRRQLPWLAGLGVFVALALAGLAAAEPVVRRLESLGAPMAAGEVRFAMWRECLTMIADRPWLGFGFGTYAYASPRFQSEATARFVIEHPHNEYLERAAELGVLGIGPAIVGMVIALFAAIRGLRRQSDNQRRWLGFGALAACGSLLIHDVVEFQFSLPSNAILFTICLAHVLVCAALRRRYLRLTLPPTAQTAALILLPFVLAAILSAVIRPYVGDLFFGAANEHASADRLDAAAVAFDWACAAEPGNIDYLSGKARTLGRMSFAAPVAAERKMLLRLALDSYERALDACPVSAHLHNRRGTKLLELGRVGDAEAELREAAVLGPSRAYIHYDLGSFLLDHGERSDALGEFRHAIRLRPLYFDPIIKRLWRMTPSYKQVEIVVPNVVSARQAFARFLFEKEENRAGLRELEHVFDLEPTDARAREHLNALHRIGDYAAAEATFRGYLRCLPDAPALRQEMAQIFVAMGRLEGGLAEFELLIDRDPADPKPYRAAAAILLKLGQTEPAEAMYRRALMAVKAEGRIGVVLDLATLLHREKRCPEALGILRSAAERFPTNARIPFQMHLCLDVLGLAEESLETLKRLVFLEPEHQNYRFRLAMQYRNMKLYQECVAELEKLLAIHPDHTAARTAVEELYSELGLRKR